MGRKQKYTVGERIHMLSLLSTETRREADGKGQLYWICRCDCGSVTAVRSSNIRKNRSCGCQRRARNASGFRRTHGGCGTPEFSIWSGMIQRCTNPKTEQFKYYGAIGVTVCERWRNSFESFLEDMGPRPTTRHSIDRIKTDGNYCPDNCRWADSITQNHNRSTSLYIEVGSTRTHLADAARMNGVNYHTVYSRLQRGWSVERALQGGQARLKAEMEARA